jgi:hypothetical protein
MHNGGIYSDLGFIQQIPIDVSTGVFVASSPVSKEVLVSVSNMDLGRKLWKKYHHDYNSLFWEHRSLA